MALDDITKGAIVLSVFFLPILSYLYVTKSQVAGQKKKEAGPLPPPTEITNIFIHPIKSCHGLTVKKAKLLPTGLDLDRQWMWVTYPDFEFLTIRNLSKMTLIRPTYDEETDTITVTAPVPNSIDQKLQFSIPAHPSPSWLEANTEKVDATIWGEATPAHAYSTTLTGPFDAFFDKQVRLVYKSPFSDTPRALASNGSKNILGRDASTCFPDLMPILVGSEASMRELNTRLEAAGDAAIDVRRFRPNILVRGTEPWDEDRWKTLRIAAPALTSSKPCSSAENGEGASFVLDVTQRCARCQVPNVDPETAEKHQREPWNTLMKYRRVDEGIAFKPCFGMLCVPRDGGGAGAGAGAGAGLGGGEGPEDGRSRMIEVGMKVEVLEVTADHRYIIGF